MDYVSDDRRRFLGDLQVSYRFTNSSAGDIVRAGLSLGIITKL